MTTPTTTTDTDALVVASAAADAAADAAVEASVALLAARRTAAQDPTAHHLRAVADADADANDALGRLWDAVVAKLAVQQQARLESQIDAPHVL